MARLIRAEFLLVYAQLLRRKSVMISLMLYPYVFTAFIIIIGYSAGSPLAFVERVGVDPVVYMITASFVLMSIFAGIDELLWRPLYDQYIGTLLYIIASPVNRIKYFSIIPIPRLTLLIIIGSSSILPVYIYYYGPLGAQLALAVIAVVSLGCLAMAPFAILVSSIVHIFNESWRALNIVRPVVMILTSVYYPRMYLPVAVYVLSSTIPSAPIVEVIQRMLMGINTNIELLVPLAVLLMILYYPISGVSIKRWELLKVREGVKTG